MPHCMVSSPSRTRSLPHQYPSRGIPPQLLFPVVPLDVDTGTIWDHCKHAEWIGSIPQPDFGGERQLIQVPLIPFDIAWLQSSALHFFLPVISTVVHTNCQVLKVSVPCRFVNLISCSHSFVSFQISDCKPLYF